MKLTLLASASLLLAVTLGSCVDSGPTAPPTSGQVKVGLEQTVRLPYSRILLRFDRLVSESRCPMGALCIQEGEVVIELTASDGRRTERFMLRRRGMEGGDESTAPPVSALGHRFRLFRLDPYPVLNPELWLLPRPLATLIVD